MYLCTMTKHVLITGVTVAHQMKIAVKILKSQVIPKEQRFQKSKKHSFSGKNYIHAVKSNA